MFDLKWYTNAGGAGSMSVFAGKHRIGGARKTKGGTWRWFVYLPFGKGERETGEALTSAHAVADIERAIIRWQTHSAPSSPGSP